MESNSNPYFCFCFLHLLPFFSIHGCFGGGRHHQSALRGQDSPPWEACSALGGRDQTSLLCIQAHLHAAAHPPGARSSHQDLWYAFLSLKEVTISSHVVSFHSISLFCSCFLASVYIYSFSLDQYDGFSLSLSLSLSLIYTT
mgnify:CR=1 FL=1